MRTPVFLTFMVHGLVLGDELDKSKPITVGIESLARNAGVVGLSRKVSESDLV